MTIQRTLFASIRRTYTPQKLCMNKRNRLRELDGFIDTQSRTLSRAVEYVPAARFIGFAHSTETLSSRTLAVSDY